MRELKTYKEEAVAIAFLSIVLMLVRWVSATVWPTTGQYDLAAETETVFWVVLRLVIYSLFAWLGLRVLLPKGYRYLKNEIYTGFERMPDEAKLNLSTRVYAVLLLSLVLLAITGCTTASAATTRDKVVARATADVGVREATGHNDGPEVERYLAYVGLGKGYSWCAAFVSYQLGNEKGVRNPRSAWSPAFSGVFDRVWTPRKASRTPQPGDVFCLWFNSLGRVGHVGFVTGFDGRYITTVEGNTSAPGSREGDGVYARRRELSKVYCISNFIDDEAPTSTSNTRTTGALRLPNAAQRNHRYQADHRNGDQAGAARYADTGAEGQRTPTASAAGARAGRAATHQAQRQGHHYGEREPRRCSSGLRVRHSQYQSAAVGQFYAHQQGHRDHDQGGSGEVPNACLGLVDVGRYCGLYRAAPSAINPQTRLA